MSAFRSDEGARLIRDASAKAHDQWPAETEQHYVPTPEGDTFVVVAGKADAPPVVLIHGAGSNSAQWMDLMSFLAEHFRVYAVDVIGEPGLSAPSRPSLTCDAHAAWLDAILDHFGIDDARFVGMSFGAWITIDFAIRRPSRVNRLSLYCPMGIGRQKKGFLVVAIFLGPFGKWGQQKTLAAMLGPELSRMPEERYTELRDQLRLINKHFRYRLAFPIFTDAELRTLTMPIQVLVGDKDAAVDSGETVTRLASTTPHADVQVLPRRRTSDAYPTSTRTRLSVTRGNDMIDHIHDTKVFHFPADGYSIDSERAATDVIGEVWLDWPDIAAIPVERFSDDFFHLDTRVAGDITQKFVTYGLRVALVGDISAHVARSTALASYVHESNRGKHVWFVKDLEELTERLHARR